MLRRDVVIKRIFLITGRTDMRRGINGLVSIVRLNYNLDPIDKGTLFLFCGIKKNTIKGLLYEGDGFCLVTKKLNYGHYCWPNTPSEAKLLSWDDYDKLMTGFTIVSTIK